MHNAVRNATGILKKGGLIVCPEETGWGIACDATDQQATERLLLIIQREKLLEQVVLLENSARIERYVNEVPEIAWDLLEVSVKPLTIILPGAKNLAPGVADVLGNLALRITRHEFVVRLLQQFRRPILFVPLHNKPDTTAVQSVDAISSHIMDSVDYLAVYSNDDLIAAVNPGIIKLWPGGRIDIVRN